ncbi:hypoxanthine phosphoribosyltransferase [bacterium]|nr:hypoxanthine phosphoribosyltransferase [bacterium]MCB2179108.1 hypoxanthine phosphoribosyltransferase [bacterium]
MEDYGINPQIMKNIERVMFTPEQIQTRVKELGQMISQDYAGKSLLMVGVLRGVVFFMVDLMRSIDIPMEVDFMAVSSYSPESRDMGLVRMVKDLELSITDQHVLFVEDIIDTGLTLNHLLRTLKTRQPASLEVCVLFNKEKRRLIDMPIKYKGFDIPDYYVVGYGLDYREKFRNLPFVGLLKAEVLQNGV